MSDDKENTYFDSLCEVDQVLQSSHEILQDTMKILKKLTDDSASDAVLLKSLEELHGSYYKLVDTTADLRYSKLQAREHQISNENKLDIENREYIIGTKSWPDLRQYVTYLENINQDSLEYINLLNKLSVELVKQVDISNPDVSEFVFDKWKPPAELQKIIDNYYDNDDKKIDTLNGDLQDYFNSIKLSRATYTLENKYLLQRHLTELNKEANYWRGELDNIELLLFGEGPHSIRKVLKNVETLKNKLKSEDVA
ncbi:similar to Saccharomyces cerevisiae YHR167W THP2 Subunit of the THO complex [Maudiozyma barnettii]|uniref:Similar to Saccharomyces cerevisiae YHR167W THP2 Subunit of the THO complex n=1 Tax=Maudiozyma barnettii TaxID=61262 RepID=A0A8H2ZHL0_9SACH|nr:Thp2p [Kazachstania barnettii]CAB4254873.1 similar to Saccharomyces cerevisiae YHR167W THP2 Subunit of the THO complex [Kazachstania barnettii]CAD1783107.1 similar to Saccharomyces cerevisiae YHR167W THP2 Subunit of the THO complex [Kazachstania barnettii]